MGQKRQTAPSYIFILILSKTQHCATIAALPYTIVLNPILQKSFVFFIQRLENRCLECIIHCDHNTITLQLKVLLYDYGRF
jgi:hypothetical protein